MSATLTGLVRGQVSCIWIRNPDANDIRVVTPALTGCVPADYLS